MDLEKLAALARQSPPKIRKTRAASRKLLRRIWSFPKPMIAAVNGAAFAGGCGIATLCDFTLAVPEAKFGYTEVKIGFIPAIVSVFLRARSAKSARATFSSRGRIIDAPKPQELGLVTEIVPAENLLDRAPTNLLPILIAASPNSLARAKRLLLRRSAGTGPDLERAIRENARIRSTADFKEGLASFLEKRKPVWQSKLED